MDRSNDYARRVLALDPLNPYRHSVVCQDYAMSRETDLALQTCDRALTLLPGDAGILALEANIYQSRGELEKSRDALRSLTPAAGDWRTLRVMSRQFLLDRKPREAVALLEKYLANAEVLATRRGMVRRWLGDALRLAGDAAARATYANARTELEQELAHQPENSLLVAELAIVQARLGNRDAAEKLSKSCSALATRTRRETFIAECVLSRIHVALAFQSSAELSALLKEAVSLRGEFPPLTPELLKIDPEYDALRGRADFQSLLMSTELPPAAPVSR
jgi:tetratricopeptide (TPR) repeat protein